MEGLLICSLLLFGACRPVEKYKPPRPGFGPENCYPPEADTGMGFQTRSGA